MSRPQPRYDEFGQRVRLQAGNGVTTRYHYEEKTRRLARIHTTGSGGETLQNMHYQYDRVGNITRTENNPFTARDLTGRSVVQSYGYDDLHRLIYADGTYQIGGKHSNRHESHFRYDTIGNFQSKDQRHWYEDPTTGEQSIRPHTTYVFDYSYGHPQPHAVKNVGGNTYHYDLNGNLTRRVDDQTGQTRQIQWNEENRITSIADQGRETVFRYDDAGMRIVKRGKYGETVYVDPNFSIRNGEVASKHIFAGSTRLATKMVMKENRTIPNRNTPVRPDKHEFDPDKNGNRYGHDKELKEDNSNNSNKWERQIRKDTRGQGRDKDRGTLLPGNSQQGLENALSSGQGNKAGIIRRLDRLGYQVDRDGRIVRPPRDGEGDDEGDPDPSPDHPLAWLTLPEEHQIWYYHGDHLGSSNVITDIKGRSYEHLLYFPYGETWVEESRSQTNLPYRFTGKELDPETGLYYFGARYYDPVVGVWVSVDPAIGSYLLGKPNGGVFSPVNLALYTYVGNNPLVFLDPDGLARILIDPGHGDHHSGNSMVDPGAVAMHGGVTYREKDLALSFSTALGQVLESMGHEVTYTRTGDVVDKNLTRLEWRTDMSNSQNPDLFGSIHLDAAASDKVRGFSVFSNDSGNKFKESIEGSVNSTNVRKPAAKNLSVLRNNKDRAALLIEVGFITNLSDIQAVQGDGTGVPPLVNEVATGIDNALK